MDPAPMDPAPNVDTLTAALVYLARGWSIVPLVPKTKRPAVTLAPFLSGEQRMTEADTRAYWSEHPDAGVAIIMGAPSGLVAIDVDPRNGGDLEQTTRDCPTGLVAQTGGGGLHLFVRHPGGRVPKGKTARPGVDRQSDGSYVVAAPSIHPDTGKPYRWLNESEPGELPAWAVEKKAEGARDAESSEPWIANAIERPEDVPCGAQEETITRLAWWASGTMAPDIALAFLSTWVTRLRTYRLNDPWTLEHVTSRLDRAYQKRALEPGAAGPLVNDTGKAGGGEVAPKEVRFISYDELAEQVRETGRRPWLIPDWLRARGLFLIAGASHFGKTWLSIDLAVSAAIGGKFLNAYTVDPGEDGGRRVLYIVGEDDAPDFMERLDAVLAAKSAQPRAYFEGDEGGPAKCAEARARRDAFRRNFRVHVDRQFLFGDRGAQAALLKIVGDFKPSLVLFDPLKDMVPGEDVDGFFAGAVVHTRFLRDLRDKADCCLGIVHHTTKKLEWDKPDAGISGRTEFIASFEHRFICFAAPRKETAGAALRWSRGVIQRRVKGSKPLDPVVMQYAGLGEELVLLADVVSEEEGKATVEGKSRADELEPRVFAIVESRGPISERGITEQLTAAGLTASRTKTVSPALDRLRDDGKVTLTQRGWVVVGGDGSRGSQGGNPGAREGATIRTDGHAHGEKEVAPSYLYRREPGEPGSHPPPLATKKKATRAPARAPKRTARS